MRRSILPWRRPIRRRFRPSGRRWLALLLAAAAAASAAGFEHPPAPDAIYGRLFRDVQEEQVFPDQKTFVDCVPRMPPAQILEEYGEDCHGSGALARPALRTFVLAHFVLPASPAEPATPREPIVPHIAWLWTVLQRPPDRAIPGSSLLPLPHPYIVPGGRFREVYYWDSYFTMLGLQASGRTGLIGSMVDNFAHLSATYGLIPNGNRTYYLSRSQPPFFSLMVDLLARERGPSVYAACLPALRIEDEYWSDRLAPTHHVVTLGDGAPLTRYWDQLATPRDESYAEDRAVGRIAGPAVYRDLRSAAESGWDFSSRWFGDRRTLATIRTTRILPVDLNCLLVHLEGTLARACEAAGRPAEAAEYRARAVRRRSAILRHFWSPRAGWFMDFDLDTQTVADEPTLAGMVPLFLGLATPDQARAAANTLRRRFERPGGVVTTLEHTGQQWDAPNGWAPLEWMTVQGLENYGEHALAAEIAHRWLTLNERTYNRTGRLMEKYNVENLSAPAGGGEYADQDGFGWTNGVYLALVQKYGRSAQYAR